MRATLSTAALLLATVIMLASIPAIGLALWALVANPADSAARLLLLIGLPALVIGLPACIMLADSLDSI